MKFYVSPCRQVAVNRVLPEAFEQAGQQILFVMADRKQCEDVQRMRKIPDMEVLACLCINSVISPSGDSVRQAMEILLKVSYGVWKPVPEAWAGLLRCKRRNFILTGF